MAEEISARNLGRTLNAGYETKQAVGIAEALSQASIIGSFGVSRIEPRQVTTGTYRGQQALGSQNIVNDSEGNRIYIKDDVSIRVILGKRSVS